MTTALKTEVLQGRSQVRYNLPERAMRDRIGRIPEGGKMRQSRNDDGKDNNNDIDKIDGSPSGLPPHGSATVMNPGWLTTNRPPPNI